MAADNVTAQTALDQVILLSTAAFAVVKLTTGTKLLRTAVDAQKASNKAIRDEQNRLLAITFAGKMPYFTTAGFDRLEQEAVGK